MMSLFLLAFWSFSPDEFSPRGPWKGPSASHRPAGETHKTFVETAKKEDPEIQNILIDSELARILQDQRKYNPHRENATFITLARNSDLRELMGTIRSIEDRFNHKYHYDWVFLNEEPFSQEFVNVTTHLISGTTKYGLVKSQHWSYPDWINQTLAEEARNDMKGQNIIYGDSESYRHMCRFESGFFFQHPLMLDYKYYWRVEPSTTIHCDIDYDVFRFMRSHNKKYGFTIALREFEATVHSLWAVTKNFISHYPHYIAKYNMIDFISDNSGESYNMCHYWSNFEVADMDFWRSKPYQDYFNYLDQAGGFFYERWGDAPIHSIAASLFLNSSEVHFFEDIGYTHPPFTHCPCNALERNLTCSCLPEQNFDWEGYSCLRNYYFAQEIPLPPGVDVY
ncbi:alpha-1,2 mannosyltransferase Ktr1p [Trichomonascus vanleenenianus]|uniref:glycosyltransferase family 15 protein n=1 Tax=Trichomonascus vanleenenianus TaxID=2268995 RepID=UPI003ECAD681